jgi:hypothetical protein
MEKKNIRWNVSWDIGKWDKEKSFSIWSSGSDTPIATTHGNWLNKSMPPT